MKKVLVFASLFGLFAGSSASAAVVSFSPAAAEIKPGQSVEMVIMVDPQGGKDFAEKIELSFPADLLEIKSFSFASNWMALTQAGYDSVDNTNGLLIKSAGMPGGISAKTAFGTVTFAAKKEGVGEVKIGAGAVSYGAASKNSLSGSSAILTVKLPVQPQAPVVSAPTQKTQTVKPKVEQAVADSAVEPEARLIEAQIPQVDNVPAVAAVAESGTRSNSIWVYVVLVLIALGVIGVNLFKRNIRSE